MEKFVVTCFYRRDDSTIEMKCSHIVDNAFEGMRYVLEQIKRTKEDYSLSEEAEFNKNTYGATDDDFDEAYIMDGDYSYYQWNITKTI